MYKLISVDEATATRNLELENLDSGTVDVCFDDSSVTSFKNFDFMEISKVYDCKIYLFGMINEEGSTFKYIKNIKVGNRELSEVSNEIGDIYYIDKSITAGNIGNDKKMKYEYTRKDLIQVNNVIHPDFE